MASHSYPILTGLHAIPNDLLNLRPDTEIDHDLLHPQPVSDEKNIWVFWHSGYTNIAPSAPNIGAFGSRAGSSASSTANSPRRRSMWPILLDTSDPATFPCAFTDGIIGADYAAQRTSDLVRWPLLLKYGGVYADVGLMQIGDLDRLWRETVGDAESRFEVLSYDGGEVQGGITNYFLASRRDNPFFARCHRLLLELWAGKYLLTVEEGERKMEREDVSEFLTDYIIQGQVMTLVLSLIDDEDRWDGPKLSQLINGMTNWDGKKAFNLLSLKLPTQGEGENVEQKLARKIVEACLQRSFGFKLAHGLIMRVLGDTLGSLWRKHEGSDVVPDTYAHWLRHGMVYWNQDAIPPPLELKVMEPLKRGPLLREY
ncbi:MAG: hypothetical protein Q9218_005311 [Villophora microphyllina]